jgi:hypothetical protein
MANSDPDQISSLCLVALARAGASKALMTGALLVNVPSVTSPKEEAREGSFTLQLTTLAIDRSIDGMQTL